MARQVSLLTFLALSACGSTDDPFADPIPLPSHYEGIAALALTSPRFPCDEFLQAVNVAEFPATAFLFKTFGEDYSCLLRFLNSNTHRPHLVIAYVTNETCRADRRCLEGEFRSDLSVRELASGFERGDAAILTGYRERAKELSAILDGLGNDHTRGIVVTGLEAEWGESAERVVNAIAREEFFEVGENPLNNKPVGIGIPELHGDITAPAGGIASEDGACLSAEQSKNFLRRNKQALVSLLWRATLQGRKCFNGQLQSFTSAPRERVPSAVELGVLRALLEESRQ